MVKILKKYSFLGGNFLSFLDIVSHVSQSFAGQSTKLGSDWSRPKHLVTDWSLIGWRCRVPGNGVMNGPVHSVDTDTNLSTRNCCLKISNIKYWLSCSWSIVVTVAVYLVFGFRLKTTTSL